MEGMENAASSRRRLRSSIVAMREVLRCCTLGVGDRSFAVAGPRF